MQRTVRRRVVTVLVGVAVLTLGAGGAATPPAAFAAGGCTTTDCGANHNQVLL